MWKASTCQPLKKHLPPLHRPRKGPNEWNCNSLKWEAIRCFTLCSRFHSYQIWPLHHSKFSDCCFFSLLLSGCSDFVQTWYEALYFLYKSVTYMKIYIVSKNSWLTLRTHWTVELWYVCGALLCHLNHRLTYLRFRKVNSLKSL